MCVKNINLLQKRKKNINLLYTNSENITNILWNDPHSECMGTGLNILHTAQDSYGDGDCMFGSDSIQLICPGSSGCPVFALSNLQMASQAA